MYQNTQLEELLTLHREFYTTPIFRQKKTGTPRHQMDSREALQQLLKFNLCRMMEFHPTQLLLQLNLKIKSILNDVLIENNKHNTLMKSR